MKISSLVILFLLSSTISKKNYRYELIDTIVQPFLDKLSVIVVPLDNTEAYKKNSDVSFVSASMIKLLILLKFFEDVENNKISLYDFYSLRKEDIVGGAGILQNLPVGTKIANEELCLYMIMYSDNTATNVLIDKLGMDNINKKAKDLGLKKTELNRKMMEWKGIENYICSDDIEFILKGIYNQNIAKKESCEKMMGMLLKNTDWAGIGKGLPEGIRYAHKTGTLEKINHDGGIVFSDKKYIINVLTKDMGYGDAMTLLQEISKVTYKVIQE